MRQIGLIPSGCQLISKEMIAFNELYVIYASTLALYIINPTTFALENILSHQGKTIYSIAASPHDSNLVAVADADARIFVWEIDIGEVIGTVLANGTPLPIIIQWDPHNADNCIAMSNNPIKISQWNISKTATSSIRETFSNKSDPSVQGTCLRWSHHQNGPLAVGCNNGAVLLLRDSRIEKSLTMKGRTSAVVDLQWDRLSSIYLLVAYVNFLSLWDIATAEEMYLFDKQSVPISSIAWMDWTAGNFISTSRKNGILKVWNVSQRHPIEQIRISTAGITGVCFGSKSKRALCSTIDGSITIYHMQKMLEEFTSTTSHTDTIFDCAFCPTNPDLFASVSFDESVRLWNTKTLKPEGILYGADNIIYSCDWSSTGRFLAAVNIAGELNIWNVSSGCLIGRYLHHQKASYSVAWNKLKEDLIMTTSADGLMVVISVNIAVLDERKGSGLSTQGKRRTGTSTAGKQPPIQSYLESDIRFRFVHPAPIFGGSWHTSLASIISTTCQDGTIRIFDANGPQLPLYILKGHSARSFQCCWSPMFPNLLASGSDDQTIRIWNIPAFSVEAGENNSADNSITRINPALHSEIAGTSSPKIITPEYGKLIGHTSFVRALLWCSEYKCLLLSGSWDATIKLWDIGTFSCLMTIHGHVADVYAIRSNQLRPFTFISCSRDTTLRVWELDASFSATLAAAVRTINFNDAIQIASNSENQVLSFEEMVRSKAPPASAGAGAGTRMALTGYGVNSYLSSRLMSGRRSKSLNILLNDKSIINPQRQTGLELALLYQKIFNFLCGANGSSEVWENAIAILRGTNTNSESTVSNLNIKSQGRLIFHESEILSQAKYRAVRKESTRQGMHKRPPISSTGLPSDLTAKVEADLRAAALIHAQCGNYQRYCELMIDVGDWMAALAAAPSVSMDFWRKLSLQYAQHQASNLSENAVPYFLASGNYQSAIDFYIKRQDTMSAMIIAKAIEVNDRLQSSQSLSLSVDTTDGSWSSAKPTTPTKPITPTRRDVNTSMSLRNNDPATHEQNVEFPERRKSIRNISILAGKKMLLEGRPILAAAQHLSIGDIDGAIDILESCNESELGYALAMVFEKDTDRLVFNIAEKCAIVGCMEQAIKLIVEKLKSSSPDVEIGLLLSKYCASEGEALDLLQRFLDNGVATPHNDMLHVLVKKIRSGWNSIAVDEETLGSDIKAAIYYIIAREYVKAATIAVSYMKKFVREPADLPPDLKRFLQYLKYIRAAQLEEPLRSTFLSYSLWFTAHEAIALGLWEIGWNMLRILNQKIPSLVGFPISVTEVQYQILIFRISSGEGGVNLNQISGNANSEISSISQKLSTLMNAMDQTSKENRSKSDHYLEGEPWGPNTRAIYKELQRLGDSLSLPSLAKVLSNQNHVRQYGSESFAEGSLLPGRNFSYDSKFQQSLITLKGIKGLSRYINKDGSCVASLNEILSWKRVNPFTPTFDGEFL